jgi:hypothetical protein
LCQIVPPDATASIFTCQQVGPPRRGARVGLPAAEGHFDEAGADHKLLPEYHGQKILLPAIRLHWPDLVQMAWHRANRFRGT